MLFSTALASAAAYGTPKFERIAYRAEAEAEEGEEIARYIAELIDTDADICAVEEGSALKSRSIFITNSPATGLWEYTASYRRGVVTIDGGGSWALRKAAGRLAGIINSGARMKEGQIFKGTVEGEFLFDRPEGCDLRILDDNIWDYSKDTIPPVWQALGVDCRDFVRAPQYAQLVRAYMPDILTIQEYNAHMDAELLPRIAAYGYVHTTTGDGTNWNNTPIFYNKDNIELLECEYVLYTPSKWSNHGSKSFTSAVFRRKSDSKVFAVLNTHLWWKSDRAQAGSSQARASQVRLMIAQAQEIKAKYNCPVFVTGDMNAEESTVAIRQFLEEGFVPCYKAATHYADMQNGHHICGPVDGFSRTSRRRSPERPAGAIDHCFIWNSGEAKVLVFDCITAYFTVPLTDHYPNLIDARL